MIKLILTLFLIIFIVGCSNKTTEHLGFHKTNFQQFTENLKMFAESDMLEYPFIIIADSFSFTVIGYDKNTKTFKTESQEVNQ